MKRSAIAAAVVAAALALGGCGIPLSATAHTVSRSGLSPALYGGVPSSTTTPPPSTTTTTPTQHPNHLVVYFVDPANDHLVQVPATWPSKVTPLIALGVLAIGPSAQDPAGLQTYLPSAPKSVSILRHGVAKVVLSNAYADLFGASLYIPLAQIVFTLMANFPEVKGVAFYLEGQTALPYNYRPDGSVSLQPVTEDTYARVLKPETEQAYIAAHKPAGKRNGK